MICRLLQQVLADKVRVMENLGLRHNDWGELAVKLGRVLKEEEFMKSAILKNQQNRMDIVLENVNLLDVGNIFQHHILCQMADI